MSLSLASLIHTFDMTDHFRKLCPMDLSMSHYYENSYRDIKAVTAFYTHISFSNHFTLILSFELPAHLEKSISLRSIQLFKIKLCVLKDQIFQERLKVCMDFWTCVADYNTCILEVWEWLIKPGICKLAKDWQREIQDQHLCILQMLFVKQSLYTSQLQTGNMSVLPLLCHTQLEIEEHYRVESEKDHPPSKNWGIFQ